MVEPWALALYVLYAYTQGVLVVRFAIREKDHPVPAVLLFALFGPIVSLFMLAWGFVKLTEVLATPSGPDDY